MFDTPGEQMVTFKYQVLIGKDVQEYTLKANTPNLFSFWEMVRPFQVGNQCHKAARTKRAPQPQTDLIIELNNCRIPVDTHVQFYIYIEGYLDTTYAGWAPTTFDVVVASRKSIGFSMSPFLGQMDIFGTSFVDGSAAVTPDGFTISFRTRDRTG
ncbi:unnamed protein product, partial [Amoebophrya sp. A25]|eukprot:GSA25T00014491001.1